MFRALCVIALTATLVVLSGAESYCDIKTCPVKTHTRCLHPNLQPSRNCGAVFTSTVTPQEINEILNAHNNLRALVASGQETRGSTGRQPAASNLGPLKWDNELAEIAQTWANQCDFNHDKCRDSSRFQVGQNIASRSSTGKENTLLRQLVQDWYDEVDQFSNTGVKSYSFDYNTGHYTQLVWAKTTLVGCGVIRYNSDKKWNNTYLVCNYGPSGNYRGQPIYEIRR